MIVHITSYITGYYSRCTNNDIRAVAYFVVQVSAKHLRTQLCFACAKSYILTINNYNGAASCRSLVSFFTFSTPIAQPSPSIAISKKLIDKKHIIIEPAQINSRELVGNAAYRGQQPDIRTNLKAFLAKQKQTRFAFARSKKVR